MPEQNPTGLPTSLTVAVIMDRELIEHRGWTVPRWRLVGVVTGEPAAAHGSGSQVIHQEGGVQRIMWSGLHLRLYRDASESYWFNLTGTTPSLFVVCQDDDEGQGLTPVLVTADHQEAVSHLEGDDSVFSTPLPPAVHQWLERFVVEHYQPEPRKQRKRKNWSEEVEGDGRAARSRPVGY